MSKLRIMSLEETESPDWSLTPTKKKDVFNVFQESTDKDFGDFHKSRLLTNGWSKEQLEYVKKNGTTNFKKIG